MPNDTDSPPKVFRDVLKEHRTDYFVEYHCAQPPNCAVLVLTFTKRTTEHAFVRDKMEHELTLWLKRYPVPLMVRGVDEREDNIHFSPAFGESHLMGYVDPGSGEAIRRWGLFRDAEMPAEQLEPAYLLSVYADVPYRLASEVKANAAKESRRLKRSVNVIVFFLVVVPVLIEVVALGVSWLGHILATISIGLGSFKAARAFGWVKRTVHDEKKAEEELHMRHHHYHCTKNPEGFARLRAENFAREAEERVRQEAEALHKKAESSPTTRIG